MVAFTPEEEKDIESVAQPDADERGTIDDAIFAANYRAEERDYERLKSLENDGKIGVKGGEALSKAIEETPVDTKKGFLDTVGNALSNFSDGMEDRLETIYDDREKRARFLSGLNTIIESSSYTPIGQAKSLVGKIATGQKKGFLESEAIGSKRQKLENERLKAMRKDPRFRDDTSEAILKLYPDFQKRFRDKEKEYGALDQRFTELYKLSQKGFEAPTGLVEEFLTPFQKVFSELGLSEQFRNLQGRVSKYDEGQDLSAEDKVAFKDLFSAATKAAIVSQVKDLYPASDKDIQVLLGTVGDVGTNPQALRKLVSVQKALMEINSGLPAIAKDEAFNKKNIEFESDARNKSALNLSEELKDKVKPETLQELFGTSEDVNPFRIINAYYYQQLEPQFQGQTNNYFETYKKIQEEKEQSLEDIINETITKDLISQ
jgi:hypothetical protein